VGDDGTAHQPSPLGGPGDWCLNVSGDVKRPADFSITDLARIGTQEVRQAIVCVSAGQLCGADGTVAFQGLPLAKLLSRVKPLVPVDSEQARPCVEFISRAPGACGPTSEPHRTSLPLSDCLDPKYGVMIAWALGGDPLPYANGGPLRSVVGPKLFFYKSVKWLDGIRVLDAPLEEHRGTWETYAGYHNRGRVELEERFEPQMHRILEQNDGQFVTESIDDDTVRRATFDEMYGRADLSRLIASQLDRIVGKREFPQDFTSVVFAKDGYSCQIRGTNFAQADFCGAKMAGSNLALSKFPAAVFSRDGDEAANMRDCDLEGAHFQNAYLQNVDMRGACLTGTTFVSVANLERSSDRVRGLDVRDAINLDGATARWLERNGAIVG
jgi:DMSO/TMAO reductase YedYZ molybdopterin-dependent catalytic subunit